MFWIFLLIFLIVFVYIDQTDWLKYQTKIIDRKLFLSRFLKKKVIDINLISFLRTLPTGAYGTQVIQAKTSEGWAGIATIAFLNYKKNHSLLNSLKTINPDIIFSPELEEYYKSGSVGDYYVNRKQAIRGLLTLLFFAFLLLIAYLF